MTNLRRRIQDKLRRKFGWHTDNSPSAGIALYKTDNRKIQFQLNMLPKEYIYCGYKDYLVEIFVDDTNRKDHCNVFAMTFAEFDLLCKEVYAYKDEQEAKHKERLAQNSNSTKS